VQYYNNSPRKGTYLSEHIILSAILLLLALNAALIFTILILLFLYTKEDIKEAKYVICNIVTGSS